MNTKEIDALACEIEREVHAAGGDIDPNALRQLLSQDPHLNPPKPINDGGPAFPNFIPGDKPGLCRDGMSLRDYFAAAAIRGVVANQNCVPGVSAQVAYEFADAMIQERSRS